MIGAVCYEGNEGWQLYQWLAPDFREEKQLLEVFSEFLKKFTCTVQYNGDVFDQPYLQARLAFHELPDPFEGLPSIDLYKILRPLKGFLKLSRLKQEQMEAFLGETTSVTTATAATATAFTKNICHAGNRQIWIL